MSLLGRSPNTGKEMIWVHRTFASIEYSQLPKSEGEATHGQDCLCQHLGIPCENTNFNPLQNVP